MSIRFAILGAGRIGQVHARAVDGNENAVLAAVFDPVEAAAASVADRYGAEIRDLYAIAAADDIDAVVICTPTDLHAQQIEKFARAGKPMFCEKPIDLDSVRVRDCMAVVEATGATLMFGFNRRFDGGVKGELHRWNAVPAAPGDGQELAVALCDAPCRWPTYSRFGTDAHIAGFA